MPEMPKMSKVPKLMVFVLFSKTDINKASRR